MRKSRTLVFVLAALASACGGSSGASSSKPVRSSPTKTPPKGSGPPALQAVEIARVPAGTFGPYVGQGRDGALLAWAPSAGDKRAWYGLPVAPDGTPSGAPRRLGDAPTEIGLVAVRGSSDATHHLVVSTRRTELGEWVEAMLVRGNGEILMAPRALAELRAQPLWVDASVTSDRALVMWAQRSDDLADIYGMVLTA